MQLDRFQHFKTTRWTLVEGLCSDDEAARADCCDRLVRAYWPPVYTWLRSRGKSPDAAGEETQAFFCEVVLTRGLFERADPERGRLRTLLLTSLKRFLIDRHRSEVSRGNHNKVSLDSTDREEQFLRSEGSTEADDIFERRWALAVFEEANRRCREHFTNHGKATHWHAFEARVIAPAVAGTTPPQADGLAEELGFRSGVALAAAMQTVKKRFLAILQEVAGETALDDEAATDEYERVVAVLS